MEPQSKVIWDLYSIAYKMGFLDKALQLSGSLLDPDINLIDALSSFEDNAKNVDLTAIDEKFEKEILPMVKELSDEKVIQGLKDILEILGPIINKALEEEGDIKAVIEKYKKLGKSFAAAFPVVKALSPLILKKASPGIDTFFKERAGQLIGNGLTSVFAVVNAANERDPEIISKFMANMFSAVDSKEFKKTADIIISNILNQKPKFAGWTVRTILKRIKKRLA